MQRQFPQTMPSRNKALVNNLAETPAKVKAETSSDTDGHKKTDRLVDTLRTTNATLCLKRAKTLVQTPVELLA